MKIFTDRQISDWPYPLVDNLWDDGNRDTWVEVDWETYDDQLGVVFPAEWDRKTGCFMVGEPWKYDEETGHAVHTVFVPVNGRIFCKDDLRKNFNPQSYLETLSKKE